MLDYNYSMAKSSCTVYINQHRLILPHYPWFWIMLLLTFNFDWIPWFPLKTRRLHRGFMSFFGTSCLVTTTQRNVQYRRCSDVIFVRPLYVSSVVNGLWYKNNKNFVRPTTHCSKVSWWDYFRYSENQWET